MKKITGELQSGHAKRGCLLRQVNFVSNSESPSFEGRQLAWEASTLPLSYTRPNHIYSSPKNCACKGRLLAEKVLASLKFSSDIGSLLHGYQLRAADYILARVLDIASLRPANWCKFLWPYLTGR